MNIDRRHFMKMSGSALAAAPLLVPPALSATGIPRLRITEPFGNPSIAWTMLTALKPGLQARLNCGVETQTITGDDRLAALKAMLGAPSNEVCLFGGNIMTTQYVGATAGFDTPFETLTPIAKLSNGYSVAVFAKRGGRFETWADVVKASMEKPVTLRTPQRNNAPSIAKLMIERWAPLPLDARKELPFLEIIPEIVDGRIDIGIVPTAIVARQRDLLSCLVTFGAERSALFPNTPDIRGDYGKPEAVFHRKCRRTGGAALGCGYGGDPDRRVHRGGKGSGYHGQCRRDRFPHRRQRCRHPAPDDGTQPPRTEAAARLTPVLEFARRERDRITPRHGAFRSTAG
jgi:hypothetical protein